MAESQDRSFPIHEVFKETQKSQKEKGKDGKDIPSISSPNNAKHKGVPILLKKTNYRQRKQGMKLRGTHHLL